MSNALYYSQIWVNWPLRFNVSVNNNIWQHVQHSRTHLRAQAAGLHLSGDTVQTLTTHTIPLFHNLRSNKTKLSKIHSLQKAMRYKPEHGDTILTDVLLCV